MDFTKYTYPLSTLYIHICIDRLIYFNICQLAHEYLDNLYLTILSIFLNVSKSDMMLVFRKPRSCWVLAMCSPPVSQGPSPRRSGRRWQGRCPEDPPSETRTRRERGKHCKHCKDCKLRIGKNMEWTPLPSRCFHSVTYLHVHFHCDKFGQYQTGEDIECWIVCSCGVAWYI